ncbi:hypothetical protein [Minwuia sp.]|uniref:hypothetical protein n=1 Tax=Minwuia sp. TaxID=2493630 RepID=UPI003A8FE8D9
MFRKLLAGSLLGIAIAACTPSQDVQVSGDSAVGQDSVQGQTIAITETDTRAVSNADLSARLTELGYRVVPATANPDLIARFNLDVGEPRTVTIEREIPEYETVQEVVIVNGQQQVFLDERFLGYRVERFDETVYPAVAELNVQSADGSGAERVRRAETEGTCGEPERLAGPMLDALFQNQPGRSVRVELPDC